MNDEAIKLLFGKTITGLELKDGQLTLTLEDRVKLKLRDNVQSCCESRYMGTDDNLADHIGSQLLGVRVLDAPDQDAGGDVHEVQFLIIDTDKGGLTISNHVEHNGYYGGFDIEVEIE